MTVVLLIAILLTSYFLSSASFSTYHTYEFSKKASFFGYDCLYDAYRMGGNTANADHLIPYCLKPSSGRRTSRLSDRSYFTFDELQKNGVTSIQLQIWKAPIDVAENYQIYLNNNLNEPIMSNYRYFNCSAVESGPQCEYSSPFHTEGDGQSFSDVVFTNALFKKYNYQIDSTVPCYIHLSSCIRGPAPLCLDWREICDGKVDCANGEDEEHCWQLEFIECAPQDEYQCHSGQCIPKEFVNDIVHSPDCLDGSDEIDFGRSKCADKSIFSCEEHTCYPQWNEQPRQTCGDGQCISRFGKCENNRQPAEGSLALEATKNLSINCWQALSCLTNYAYYISEKPCYSFCDGECVSKIVAYCPQYIRFPVFQHVFFVYSKEKVEKLLENELLYPTYVCYNASQCTNTLMIHSPSVLVGERCFFYDSLNITVPSQAWIEQIIGVRRVFASLCEPVITPVFSSSFQCPNGTHYQCAHTTKCIAIRRLVDGFFDCDEGDDETFNESCSLKDSISRFRCPQENKCVAARAINDGHWDCHGGHDEMHPQKRASVHRISFPTICDGFQELEPIFIDGRNETDETDCSEWACNNTYTYCNNIWNCANGVDEIGCGHYSLNCPPLYHHCMNRTTGQLICLPLSKANNGDIDCLGGSDEIHQCQNVVQEKCGSLFMTTSVLCDYQTVEKNILCSNNNETRCMTFSDICLNDKPQSSCLSNNEERRLLCRNTTIDCTQRFSHLDNDEEIFLCVMRKRYLKRAYHTFQISINPVQLDKRSLIPFFEQQQAKTLTNVLKKEVWPCHRGVLMLTTYNRPDSNQQPENKCLCPPPYYGDYCEYQSPRVSLTVRVQMSADLKGIFTFVYYLINDHDEIESYDQFIYVPSIHCKDKKVRYLLYTSRLKSRENSYTSYSVRFEVYDRHTLDFRASWLFPLNFTSFLPVQRLAVKLYVPARRSQCHHNLDFCGSHGQCSSFTNTGELFCRCNTGWTGKRCNELVQTTSCDCAPESVCLYNLICLCPLNRHGQRCYLPTPACPSDTCQNNGTCINLDPRASDTPSMSVICVCPDGYFGSSCNYKLNRVHILFHDILIPPLIFIHFIEVAVRDSEHKRTTTFKKVTIDQDSISFYTSFNFNIVFTEFSGNYYLIYFNKDDNKNTDEEIEMKIFHQHRCPWVGELFNHTFGNSHLLRRIKYYHVPCRRNNQLRCFYDDIHLCYCDEESRANCLTFDHKKTHSCQGDYGDCENGAKCFHDSDECPLTSACLCPECFYGFKCQFSTQHFSLFLDAILGSHIRPNASITKQPMPVKITIALTLIIFILGTTNSLLTFLTFKTKTTRKVGCGLYFFGTSLSSLFSVSMVTLKVTFLLLAQAQRISNRSFLLGQCMFIDFLIRVSLTSGNWLIACVSFERGIAAVQGVHFDQAKSVRIAKRMCFVLLLLTVCTALHDPLHRRLIDDDVEQRTWCIVRYQSSALQKFDYSMNLVHFILPFAINFISAITIIFTLARSCARVQRKMSFNQHLIEKVRDHKHLLLGPLVLVLLAIPRLIIALLSGCMTSARNPWLFLISYFSSIIPSLLTFVTFVLTSKVYMQEFRKYPWKYFTRTA